MHAAGPCVRVPEGVAARAAQARRAGSADRGARVGRGRALDGFCLHLRFDFDVDLGDAASELTVARRRKRLPEATPVQRERVDTEVRALADDASSGLGAPWVESVRRAASSRSAP